MLAAVVQVMMVQMVRVLKPTGTTHSHAQLLLWMLVMITARKLLLTLDTSWNKHNRSVCTLLQTVVFLGVRITVTVAKILWRRKRKEIPLNFCTTVVIESIKIQIFTVHHIVDA